VRGEVYASSVALLRQYLYFFTNKAIKLPTSSSISPRTCRFTDSAPVFVLLYK
jgi:hypothetical protein